MSKMKSFTLSANTVINSRDWKGLLYSACLANEIDPYSAKVIKDERFGRELYIVTGELMSLYDHSDMD